MFVITLTLPVGFPFVKTGQYCLLLRNYFRPFQEELKPPCVSGNREDSLVAK